MTGWNPGGPGGGPRQGPRIGVGRAAAAAAAPAAAAAAAAPVVPAAPAIAAPNPNLVSAAELTNYTAIGHWRWYSRRPDIKDEGWKLHVSGNVGNAAQILGAVLPVLRAHNIAHKFLLTSAEVALQNGDAQQQGKMLAVYPDDIGQAFNIVGWIDGALNGQAARAGSPPIANEIPVGNTVVYTRYGAYNSSVYDPINLRYVDDPIGQTHPGWIQNPWPGYPAVAPLAAFPAWPTHTTEGHRRMGRQ